VTADGFAPTFRRYQAPGGEGASDDVDLGEIVLARGRTVSGRVVDSATGRPVAGAEISLGDPEQLGRARLATLWEWEKEEEVETGEDGSFRLRHVEERPRAIFVAHPRYPLHREVLPPEARQVTLRVSRGGVVFGTVQDAEGRPLAVTVEGTGVDGAHRASTDRQGRYRLEKLPPGELILQVRSEGQLLSSIPVRTVQVAPSGELRVDLRGSAGGVRLRMAVPGEFHLVLVPGRVAPPSDFVGLAALFARGLRPEPAAAPDTHRFKNVGPGEYTLLMIEAFPRRRVAHQVVVVGTEPEQRVVVEAPTTFAELR